MHNEKLTLNKNTPVRVSIPASVASDLGRLKDAFRNVMDFIGCPQCCSGSDIFWEIQRDFTLTKLGERANSFRPKPAFAKTSSLRIAVSPKVSGDLKSVFSALDRIAELTGHPACATGCDMQFRNELTLVLDSNLKLDEQVLEIGALNL